ncbi:hypothetical protein K9N68_16490 [Kovacikia minuta CCNUW1]|uniref:hypothetical protein n=1 Tax=Kovacikia minuta TaxID=2931930 RepID=UPI001CCA03A8|nr:hypothetical protein [Kovacikia minuta]UBF29285.1 hypothetical protein K9N68_16490 [Kovacikia minuta CCNUW1]
MAENNPPLLPLQNMAERHQALTPSVAGSYLEAARVCLDQHHVSPKEFTLENDKIESIAKLEWESADNRIQAAWANVIDATEAGAYALAIAATELLKGMVAVHRAETMTGADYYIAPAGEELEDLEHWWRLEVSGTHSDKSEVKRRLRVKIDQARQGNSNRPALAAVIGFRVQLILLQTVDGAS